MSNRKVMFVLLNCLLIGIFARGEAKEKCSNAFIEGIQAEVRKCMNEFTNLYKQEYADKNIHIHVSNRPVDIYLNDGCLFDKKISVIYNDIAASLKVNRIKHTLGFKWDKNDGKLYYIFILVIKDRAMRLDGKTYSIPFISWRFITFQNGRSDIIKQNRYELPELKAPIQ